LAATLGISGQEADRPPLKGREKRNEAGRYALRERKRDFQEPSRNRSFDCPGYICRLQKPARR
jgi:hypothetical protein